MHLYVGKVASSAGKGVSPGRRKSGIASVRVATAGGGGRDGVLLSLMGCAKCYFDVCPVWPGIETWRGIDPKFGEELQGRNREYTPGGTSIIAAL